MLAVIDCRAPLRVQEGLIANGFEPILLPPHPNLAPPVASHPDMLICFLKDRILTTREYASVAAKELQIIASACQKPIDITDAHCSQQYPQDVFLNVAIVGNIALGHPQALMQAAFSENGYRLCPVRQGYAKCSTLPIGERALISSDPSIIKKARELGLDVLKIDPAPIELEGYDNGFLGGATACSPYTAHERVYFCGDWKLHPNADQIERFCKKHHKAPVSLCEGPLTDLGTVFTIY